MRFFSKSPNYRAVLRPSLPGNIFAGKLPEPGIYVKFKDGVADVAEEDMIQSMLKHPGYNMDFISADADPFQSQRQETEPIHVMTEMQGGSAVKKTKSDYKPQLTPEVEQYLKTMATAMAKEMAQDALKAMFSTMNSKETAIPEEKKIEITPAEPISAPSKEELGGMKSDYLESLLSEAQIPEIPNVSTHIDLPTKKRMGRPPKNPVAIAS